MRCVFELLLGRDPSTEEINVCLQTDLALVCRGLFNSNEFAFLP